MVDQEQTLVLAVETRDGVFLRGVQPARTLPTDVETGQAAEDATRSAAAIFGLPDFVFRSARRSTGSGTRELGDAILVVGDVAASVQVKARVANSGESGREHAWLDRKIEKAARQALGTIRSMSKTPATLMNERGRSVRIDGPSKSWVPIVVVDHRSPPGGYKPPLSDASSVVVLLRRDWEFLFEQLKSTDAVIRYLHRVSPLAQEPLGEEPRRYYELAAADAAAPPGPVDPRLVKPGMKSASTPVLPQAPAGLDDRPVHILLRVMMEDLANCPRPEGFEEADMLEALAAVDTLAIGYRTEMGRTLLSWLHDVTRVGSAETRWRFRRVNFPDRPQLIFAAATRWDEIIHPAFSMYVTLRHDEVFEALGRDEKFLTVGVLLTPRRDGPRAWDTTMTAVRGDLQLDGEYRRAAEELWPDRSAEAS